MKAVEEKGKEFLGVVLSIPHELWGMAADHRLWEERRGERRRGERRGGEGRGGQDTVCDITTLLFHFYRSVYTY